MAAGGDKYVLAIDMGSGSAKAALVSNRGGIAGSGLRPIGTSFIPGGGAEQDPEQWWSAVIAAPPSRAGHGRDSARAHRGHGVHHAVGVTVPVDEGGHAIWNAISWMDTRGGRYSRAAADGWPKIEGYGGSEVAQMGPADGGRAQSTPGMDGFGHMLYFKHERPRSVREHLQIPGADGLSQLPPHGPVRRVLQHDFSLLADR